MSYAWWFASFEPDALARLLGGGHERELDAFVDLVGSGSDEFDPSDPEIARALLESGFSYDGFDARNARTADDIVIAAFSETGFWNLLAMRVESPDTLHPGIIKELLERSGGGGAMLPLLRTGRRCGEETPSPCEYVVLAPEEVTILLKEVRRAMAAPVQWSAPYMPEVVVECLIEPLENSTRDGRWVFASLG